MLDTPTDAPKVPANREEWLSVSEAAGRLGISTKTLRKRMARGEVAFRRVVLARGGAAYEVEMESEMERSKPMFQTDASKFQSDFQTERKNGRNGSRFGSRNGTPSSVNRSVLETEVEHSKPTSKTVSKPTLEMEREVARLRADLEHEREGAAFLRGVIEQLQRDGAETRSALREALKLAPKQLAAGESSTMNQTARNAPQSVPNGEVGTHGPKASKGTQTGGNGGESLSYGNIADMLEAQLNSST